MQQIVEATDSKSLTNGTIRCVSNKNFLQADDLLSKADDALIRANSKQFA